MHGSAQAFLAALLFAATALAAGATVNAVDGVFVTADGMSPYTLDHDVAGSGKSVCNGPCDANWPPLPAAAGATASGAGTIIVSDDGARQWADKGKPVHRWGKHQKPGDRTGDGGNNTWRLARP